MVVVDEDLEGIKAEARKGEGGTVFLRGEVDNPDLIQDLEKAARKVQGVREVENLLHAAGTPAPTRSS